MRNLTEEQILSLIDENELIMGGTGCIDKSDKSGDGGVPTKKDTDGGKQDNSFVQGIAESIYDIFYNRIVFEY